MFSIGPWSSHLSPLVFFQLPTFKHGATIVNESYAACFYLETQFKSQGNKLVPDGVEEQALMYQRMFEGLTFYDKLCKMPKISWP